MRDAMLFANFLIVDFPSCSEGPPGPPPPGADLIELEDGSGTVLLEDGSGSIQLEA